MHISVRTDDECEEQIRRIMREYNLDLYEESNMMVSEEEFVYDSMRNSLFCQMLSDYLLRLSQEQASWEKTDDLKILWLYLL